MGAYAVNIKEYEWNHKHQIVFFTRGKAFISVKQLYFLQISNAWMRNLFYLTESNHLHWNLKITKSWSNNNVRCVHWNMYKEAS